MEARLDIVGHFGTTFSYATVGSRVAREMLEAGKLGRVMNLDAEWHPSHFNLRDLKNPLGSHLLLIAPPLHFMDAFPARYGRERSAIFVSPNTDRLAREHAQTCEKFGLAIAPSEWCEGVVREWSPKTEATHLPLGVDESLTEARARGVIHRVPRVLHFSTDQSWPGRKGTEELLSAWAMLKQGAGAVGELLLHVPPRLRRDALYRVRDLEIGDSVTFLDMEERGAAQTASLVSLFDSADLVVAPSRCEGFGMMLLAALVARVPLVCTYNTGHRDFLASSHGWLGVPTPDVAPIFGEDGLAPIVEPRVLAQTLRVAMEPEALRRLHQSPLEFRSAASVPGWGTWSSVLPLWRERLTEWMEETCPKV